VTRLPYGSGAARFHLLRAHARAMLSRGEEAVEALHAADEARRRGGPAARDELHDEVGGEFAFRPAKHHYYASAARLHLGHITEAIEEGHRALQLYAEDEPHHRSYGCEAMTRAQDRKSTRLNSSHVKISYAVFCLKK